MGKRSVLAIATVMGLVVFSLMMVPLYAASLSSTYGHRAAVTLTLSGGTLSADALVCVPYDPTNLFVFGYLRETSGTIDDVKLDDLTGTDRYLMNTGSGASSCLWGKVGSEIADGSTESWDLYVNHPTDTRTPIGFLNLASDSIDVPDAASLQLDSGWWIEIASVSLDSAPDDALLLASKKASNSLVNYEIGVNSSGYAYVTVTPMAPAGPTVLSPIYPTSGGPGDYTPVSCSNYDCVNNASDTSQYFANTAGTKTATMGQSGFGVPTTAEGTCLTATMRRRYSNSFGTYTAFIDYGTATVYSFDLTDSYPGGGAPTSFATKTSGCHADSANLTGAFVNSSQNFVFYGYHGFGNERRYATLSLSFTYTYLAAGTPVTATATTNLAGGVTHTLVGEYESDTIRVFVDDILEASSAAGTDGAVYTGADALTLLAASGSADYYRSVVGVTIAPSSASADVLSYLFPPDYLTQTQAGTSANGWVWKQTVTDQSASANDGTWNLTADQTGLTVGLGVLQVQTPLPEFLINTAGPDNVGDLIDLTGTSTATTFPGLVTLTTLVNNVGLPVAPLWFILVIIIFGIPSAVLVRSTQWALPATIIVVVAIAFGSALGLYPWYYAVFGALALLGSNAINRMVGGRG